jgi:hypothetical protein
MSDDVNREPVSSEEMIERARNRRIDSSEDLIEAAKEAVANTPEIGDLANIDVSVPIEETFPEPLPRLETARPRRVQRQRVQLPQGPISTDKAPRALVVAVATLILLIAVGVAIAALSSVP